MSSNIRRKFLSNRTLTKDRLKKVARSLPDPLVKARARFYSFKKIPARDSRSIHADICRKVGTPFYVFNTAET